MIILIIEEWFEDIFYPNLKSYVETTSTYNPKVTKKRTQESKIFPIVPIRLLYSKNSYNNLSYGEETFNFSVEMDIYSIDIGNVSKRTICNEITQVINDYLKDNYHFTIKITIDTPNADSNIHRNNIRITGKLDTKYGNDKLVIYPK